LRHLEPVDLVGVDIPAVPDLHYLEGDLILFFLAEQLDRNLYFYLFGGFYPDAQLLIIVL